MDGRQESSREMSGNCGKGNGGAPRKFGQRERRNREAA